MPTYADQWNEQQRAKGLSGPSNPVRLTITKGQYEWDPHANRFCYVERWEEEHLMEDEELYDANHLASLSSGAHERSRASSPPLLAALEPSSLSGRSDHMRTSLWVLDTNTLLSCLDLLKALFASLLTRNVAYAASVKQQRDYQRSSSIKLVLPYIVVSELDGLKMSKVKDSSRASVAKQAREANHWLLSALQKQKRVPIDEAGSNLPDDLWPLFVQPSSHYKASKGSRGDSRWVLHDSTTPDDEIVQFCVDLRQQTSTRVRFCSDDINALTKAETDGIDALRMRELAKALNVSFKDVRIEERWTYVAEEIIDQWEYQISTEEQQQHQQKYHDRHSSSQPARIDSFSAQTAWQAATATSHPQLPAQLTAQTPALDTSHQFTATATNDEILEVDMETEEHSRPSNGPSLAALAAPSAPYKSRHTSPTAGGRSSKDSMHSPHNARPVNRTRPTRLPPSSPRLPASPSQAESAFSGDPLASETLNPTIEWEDLVQPLLRPNNKQRNGRW